MKTELISDPTWKNIQERDKRIAKLERQLGEAYNKIQTQGEALFFKDKEIKDLREIIENDSDNEADARKAAGSWDRSSPEGVEPLADIIERLILRMTEDQAEISRLYKTLDGLRAETHAAGVAWDDERLRLHDAINNLHDAINNWHKIADERSAEIIRLQETISDMKSGKLLDARINKI